MVIFDVPAVRLNNSLKCRMCSCVDGETAWQDGESESLCDYNRCGSFAQE